MMNLLAPIVSAFERHHTEKWFYPGLLAALVLLGMTPMLIPGIPNGHDLYYHMSRIYAMSEGMKNGQMFFMVNHTALGGCGYASGLFYQDLFLYPVGLLCAAGVGITAAYKLFLAVWILFTAFSTYHAGMRIGGRPFAAFACALLYVQSSYFAVDVFNRAALGEVQAFAFLPWAILGIYECVYGNEKNVFPLIFGFAGLVLSHNLTLLTVSIVAAFLMLFNLPRFLREPGRIVSAGVSGLAALLLGSGFLIPLFEAMRSDRFIISERGAGNIAERAVPFTRLFLEIPYMKLAFWMPSGIGIIFAVVLLRRIGVKQDGSPRDAFRDASLIAGACSLLAATNFLPWEGALRALSIIQFPWRFYLPATAFLAMGGGLLLSSHTAGIPLLERRWLWILIVGCCGAWWLNTGYVYAAKIHEKAIFRQFRPGRIQEASGVVYLPVGTDPESVRRRGAAVTAANGADASFSNPSYGVFKVRFSKNKAGDRLELPLIPYKGYSAELNGRPLKLGKGSGRLMAVELPAGTESGEITVRYAGTKIQKVSHLISFCAWIAFAAAAFFFFRKKRTV